MVSGSKIHPTEDKSIPMVDFSIVDPVVVAIIVAALPFFRAFDNNV